MFIVQKCRLFDQGSGKEEGLFFPYLFALQNNPFSISLCCIYYTLAIGRKTDKLLLFLRGGNSLSCGSVHGRYEPFPSGNKGHFLAVWRNGHFPYAPIDG